MIVRRLLMDPSLSTAITPTTNEIDGCEKRAKGKVSSRRWRLGVLYLPSAREIAPRLRTGRHLEF